MRILADRVAYRGLRYVSSRHAVPDQAITFGWLSLLTAGGLAAGVSQPVWPVNFRRTASISRLADTFVAGHDATAVHRDGDVDAEVAPVDLRGRLEAGPLPAERVRAGPVHLDGQRHLPGDSVRCQLTVDDPAAMTQPSMTQPSMTQPSSVRRMPS